MTADALDAHARTLVANFDRMVRRDGGSVVLAGAAEGLIRVHYRPGADPECDDGACVLPHVELEQMMNETAARRDPSVRVVVELVR